MMEQLAKDLKIKTVAPQTIHKVHEKEKEKVVLGNSPDQIIVSGAHKRRINGTYYKKHKLHDGKPYYEKTPDAADSWLVRWSSDSECWVFNDKRDKMYTN